MNPGDLIVCSSTDKSINFKVFPPDFNLGVGIILPDRSKVINGRAGEFYEVSNYKIYFTKDSKSKIFLVRCRLSKFGTTQNEISNIWSFYRWLPGTMGEEKFDDFIVISPLDDLTRAIATGPKRIEKYFVPLTEEIAQ